MLIDYDNPATWPSDVISFLDTSLTILDDWLTTNVSPQDPNMMR